jgi:NitT/TauT family transport system substrate-binding protein
LKSDTVHPFNQELKMSARRFLSSLFCITLVILMTACGVLPGQTAATSAPVTLKVTALPILETLPMYVAQQEGLFAAHGVTVEVVTAASAPERDQLIASGQADGMVNELLGAMLYNKDQTQVQVIRYARSATADAPLFSILASTQSGITTVAGLKGATIGISTGTIIEYLTDRLLQKEGLAAGDYKKVAVPKLSDRLALVGNNGVNAAVFPMPQTELAIQQGAVSVIDDSSHPEYSFSVLTFRKAVLDKNPAAVKGFLAAWEEAVAKINANPDQYKSLLVKQKILPESLSASFKTPKFVTAGVPTPAQFMDMLDWAKNAKLLTTDPVYDQNVTAAYLPK